MGLKAGSGGARSNVFVNLATVVSVEDISKDSKAHVAIKVTVQQENLEYTNSFNISGWHSYDDMNKVEGWKSSFKVKEFFENCGLTDETLTDDYGMLLPQILPRCTNQQIWIVRYPNKEGKRWTWDRTSSVLQGRDYLLTKWKKDVAMGYPKDYDEGYMYTKTEPSTEFPYGANVKDDSGLPPDLPADEVVPGIPNDL